MKNMTTYLGCIVLALFVMYLCTNMMKLNRNVVEGLTSGAPATPDQLLEMVKTSKTKYVDELHIDKYKTKFISRSSSIDFLFLLLMVEFFFSPNINFAFLIFFTYSLNSFGSDDII